MKFISAEQFLKVSSEVKESLLTWWDPSIGDLVESTVEGQVWCLTDSIQVNRVDGARENQMVVPLLTVGQLIEYIEYKTGNLEIKITCADAKNTLLDTLWEEVQRINQ